MTELDTIQRYTGNSTWEELTAQADEVLGYELARDELMDALTGVPHLITHVTFRPGIVRKTDKGDKQYAYVSCQAVVGPMVLAKVNGARKSSGLERADSLTALPFEPGSHVVYNDGSTGIYRQIVEYLHHKGLISVSENPEREGGMGESAYDLPPGDWQDINSGDFEQDDEGFTSYDAEVRLFCPRGLRISEYQSKYNPDGSKTRYLA